MARPRHGNAAPNFGANAGVWEVGITPVKERAYSMERPMDWQGMLAL